jgi:hypothetical protein
VVTYPATPEHPAQIAGVTKDVFVGTWNTTKLSNAWPAQKRAATLERVRVLKDAVIKAREEANGAEIVNQKIGEAIFKYILG